MTFGQGVPGSVTHRDPDAHAGLHSGVPAQLMQGTCLGVGAGVGGMVGAGVGGTGVGEEVILTHRYVGAALSAGVQVPSMAKPGLHTHLNDDWMGAPGPYPGMEMQRLLRSFVTSSCQEHAARALQPSLSCVPDIIDPHCMVSVSFAVGPLNFPLNSSNMVVLKPTPFARALQPACGR